VAWLPSIFTKRMVIPWSHMIDEVHLNRRSVEQYIGARIIKIKKGFICWRPKYAIIVLCLSARPTRGDALDSASIIRTWLD
jgi:hypothetical protein